MPSTYEPTAFCPRCGYRLDHGPCPECGATFEHAAAASPRSFRARVRRIALLALAAALLPVGLWYAGSPIAYRWWPQSHLESLSQGQGMLADAAGRILEWREARAEAEANRRITLIREELRTMTGAHPWAGDYSRDYGIGSIVFAIAPHTGYAIIGYGQIGTFGFHYGAVEEAGPHRLRLTRAGGTPDLGIAPPDGEWLIVPWDHETWIVPSGRLREFALESNSGYSFKGFVRGGSGLESYRSLRRHPGVPDLPREFARFLLSAPVECTLTDVDAPSSGSQFDDFTQWTMVGTVDAGGRQGLVQGLKLFPRTQPFWWCIITVESVDEETATVRVRWASRASDVRQLPQPGWRLSTHDRVFLTPEGNGAEAQRPSEPTPP